MKIGFVIITAIILSLFLVPIYIERHTYLNLLWKDHTVCYGISYTASKPFSQCTIPQGDCYTTLNAGTVCTKSDMADIIGFTGVTLIIGSCLLLASIGIAYPISRKTGLF